jgi:tripartite-type tricarboxylate transporter receptor subunit TctC
VVRIIVPLSPGGGADTLARLVAEALGKQLNGQFIVENRAGGGTVIGTQAVVRAQADGAMLLMAQSSLAMSTALQKELPYDVLKDLAPIVNVALGPNALVINPSIPVKTVKEFIAWARTQPKGVTFSTSGVGTPAHMAAELFKVTTGLDMILVPNKGMNPAIQDVVAGNTQALFAGLPAAAPFERAGRLRLLAVAETKRSALSPNTPTVAEAGGFPGFDVANWTGLLGPAALPRPIVESLNGALNRFLESAEAKEKLATMGFDAIGGTPASFADQLKHDVTRWNDLVKRAGIPKN